MRFRYVSAKKEDAEVQKICERKKDQELEKTESEDTDSDSITEDNKTGKRRSRSQQGRPDKGKSTKPKIVSSKLTYRKKYSKSKTKSYLRSSASSGSSSSETKPPVKKFIKEKMFTKSNKCRRSVSDKHSDYRNLNSEAGQWEDVLNRLKEVVLYVMESVSDPARITTLIYSASIFEKSTSRNERSVKNMKAFI